MKRMQWGGAVCASVLMMVGAAARGQDQDIETQGRALLEKNKKAVVTVQMVIKQKFSADGMGSREDESKSEATGVIVDPSGLVVLSLSNTDPSSVYEDMMGGGEFGDRFKIESSVSDVKILLEDGKEVPAQVVLRDKDLDLAFVRPVEKPAEPMAAVDLAQSADPRILEPLIALNRLGKVAGRAYAASIERVSAIIRKPRTWYVPGSDATQSSLGCPVFVADGRIVGIVALRRIKGDSGGDMMRGGMDNMLPVIVPAADILEGAKQAPEKAPEPVAEPAPETPAPESTEPEKKEDSIVIAPNPGDSQS